MAKFQTLTENWVSNSNTQGGLYSGFFGTTSISGNQCNYTISSGGLNYQGFNSAVNYSLVDSYMYMQLINAGNQALTSLEVFLSQMALDSNNKIFWYLNQNVLQCIQIVATVHTQIGTNLSYNATTHQYFRIRELNNVVYWDYSQDGIDWTNWASTAAPFALTSLQLQLSAGVFNNEASGTTVITGNMNVVDTNRPANLLYHATVGNGMSRSEVAN